MRLRGVEGKQDMWERRVGWFDATLIGSDITKVSSLVAQSFLIIIISSN